MYRPGATRIIGAQCRMRLQKIRGIIRDEFGENPIIMKSPTVLRMIIRK